MSYSFDRAVTVVLTCAICVMAVVIAKRVLLDRPEIGPPPTTTFEDDWEELAAIGRRTGLATAPIQVIEIADLQCPGCRAFQATLDRIIAKYQERVALVFIHFPLTYHAEAMNAHRGAECAYKVNRFSEFARSVYAKQESLPHRTVWAYARDAGIQDSTAFDSCLSDTSSTDPSITAGLLASKEHNIANTPTVIVNGWRYSSVPAYSHMKDLIDDILKGRPPRPIEGQPD